MFKSVKKYALFVLFIFLPLLFIGWGQVGHRIINKKTSDGFPSGMAYFKGWSTYLANHASDADNRKGSDPTEEFRHYIDIDDYPEFVSSGSISQNLDTMFARYGSARVNDNGILPWAILKTTDSLTKLFRQKDWARAQVTAADLGHYVGDGHMPLHITKNYNGQLSNQTGVHSRYESTMIGDHEADLVFTVSSAEYIANRSEYVFQFIYENNKYVDSVLQADSIAKVTAGGSYNSTYKTELWKRTKTYTIMLFQKASSRLSSLIYTAWKDAGSPDTTTFTDMMQDMSPITDFTLQAYPNPFNAQITLTFTAPQNILTGTQASLNVYSISGEVMAQRFVSLRAGEKHHEAFSLNNCPSGVYYAVIRAGQGIAIQKIVLLK